MQPERGPESGRFVWPPVQPGQTPTKPSSQRPSSESSNDAPASPRRDADRNAAAQPERVDHSANPRTTPARDIESDPPSQPAPSPLAQRDESWWSQTERVWLDVTAPPLDQRAREAGWQPDSPGTYCTKCLLTLDRSNMSTTLGVCESCVRARPPWDRGVRLGRYRGPLADWVEEVKFTRWRRLGRDLGQWLGEAVREQARLVLPADMLEAGPIIIPVPMSLPRRLVRGIDHTHVLARGVRDVLGGQILQPLVRKHRPSQRDVTPSDRSSNLRGAVGVKPGWMRPRLGRDWIVIVEDVMTSGSTLRLVGRHVRAVHRLDRAEAQKVPAERGPHVWIAVVARAGEGGAEADGIES